MRAPLHSLLTSVFWLLSSAVFGQSIYYANCIVGDNSYDGLSAAVTNGHGPKLNISAAIDAAGNSNSIVMASGFYQETNWNAGAKSLTLLPQGTVVIYGSDPWQTDSIGDGISDGWRQHYFGASTTTNNSSCASCDPDGDGVSNLDEYLNGSPPLNSDNTPPVITFTPHPNSNGWYNTDVTIYFFATDTVSGVVSVSPQQVTVTGETNDAEIVATATDAAGNTAIESVPVNIDKTPPTILLDPGNGDQFDNSYPLLIIDYGDTNGLAPSGLNLDTLSITLGNVDVTTDFYQFANRAILSTNLSSGTYTWSATISDYAGNSVTSTVSFFATGTTNDAAPVLSGLNITDGMVLPDVPEVWVQGKVSGSLSLVSASVNGGDSITMNRREGSDDFGYLLPLEPGTNLIALVASNDGTNRSSQLVSIIRTAAFRAAITSPGFGSFAEGAWKNVTGYVSAKIDEGQPTEAELAGLTINGAPATLDWKNEDADGNVPFYTEVILPPGPGPIAITGEISWSDGRKTKPTPSYDDDYQIVSRSEIASFLIDGDGEIVRPGSYCDANAWFTMLFEDQYTNAFSFASEDQTAYDTYWRFRKGQGCTTTNIIIDPCCSENFDQLPDSWWPASDWALVGNGVDSARSLSCGIDDYWNVYTVVPGAEWFSFAKQITDATLSFRAPWHYPTNQLVIFTFEGMNYTSASDETGSDLAQVSFVFNGQTNQPAIVSNDIRSVSYVVTMAGGRTNTLSMNSFIWPALPSSDSYLYGAAHTLSFTNFHSNLPTCGPDVTAWVYSVLSDVYAKWNSWDATQRCVACETLIDIRDYTPGSGWWTPAAGAWDINTLYDIGTGTFVPQPHGLPAGAPHYFDRTVTFQERCYYASAVNYALWGEMFSLCAGLNGAPTSPFSEDKAIFIARLWKAAMYGGEGYKEAKAFTKYGYSGVNPSGASIAAVPDHDHVLDRGKGDWFWIPSFPSVTPPRGACIACKVTHNTPWIPIP
jgi:hypothetical protein